MVREAAPGNPPVPDHRRRPGQLAGLRPAAMPSTAASGAPEPLTLKGSADCSAGGRLKTR
ncbi:hypothetical protein GCM10010187_44250 [Actinomadura coerulea]|nr:hypothetical protein GCM10010187_44250 [Actinomadura coerulea]